MGNEPYPAKNGECGFPEEIENSDNRHKQWNRIIKEVVKILVQERSKQYTPQSGKFSGINAEVCKVEVKIHLDQFNDPED